MLIWKSFRSNVQDATLVTYALKIGGSQEQKGLNLSKRSRRGIVSNRIFDNLFQICLCLIESF